MYSFSIILWELLTGSIPWEGMQMEEIESRVCAGARPQLPALNGDVRFDFMINMVQMAWQGNPVVRPSFSQIAAAFADKRE